MEEQAGRARSGPWYGTEGGAASDVASFIHRAFTKAMGYDDADLQRPVIGICNTASELNHCNRGLKDLAEFVKRGVLQAGGLPLEFPTISIGEVFVSPTSMFFRNLAAMDTEEMIRGQPLDGVVLLAGCDKTTPAQLMGAASADVPAIMLTGGPMLNGRYEEAGPGGLHGLPALLDGVPGGDGQRGDDGGPGGQRRPLRRALHGDGHRLHHGGLRRGPGDDAPRRGGDPGPGQPAPAPGGGHRAPGGGPGPGRAAPLPDHDPEAFENAIRVLHAVGGSTNAVVHLPAIAGRVGIDLPLDLFDALSRSTPGWPTSARPVATRWRPCSRWGRAGGDEGTGPPAARGVPTVTGETVAQTRPACRRGGAFGSCSGASTGGGGGGRRPARPRRGLAILRGNLCPDGAVIKHVGRLAPPAAPPGPRGGLLLPGRPRGRIDDPDLPVTAESVLVLQNAGPVGAPGMPEVGNLPIPRKLLAQGVRDMVRVSDARMSGTSYGTIVLHVAPESGIGGPLAGRPHGGRGGA